MLIIKVLSSGLGSILAGERRTSKIWIIHQYRAIIMGTWKYIYVSTYTEKQEYGRFITYSFTLLFLLPSISGQEAETISKESSVVYLLQSSGEKMFSKERCSLIYLHSQSAFHLPAHAEVSTWWFNCLFVFYPCFNLSFPSLLSFPDGSDGKESACSVGDLGSVWVWKIP